MSPLILIILAVIGAAAAAFFVLGANKVERRIKMVTEKEKPKERRFDLRATLFGSDDSKDLRRRQVQESVSKLEERAKISNRRKSLQDLLDQAGIDMALSQFQAIAAGVALALAVLALIAGLPILACVAVAGIGFFGLPRWLLSSLISRRRKKFLEGFPDAIDIMVRAIKSGLPVSDALRVISAESPAPIGPEFIELVEGQRLGISIEQGLERMAERIALPEINFLAIVMNIQSKAGGNLSEALGNLSRVLRERRKMRGKISAVSQEAKSSAMIIGALPFVIIGGLSFVSPGYLAPLWETSIGNMLVIGCLFWMGLGTFVMSRMIKLDI
jgi:tight adherence protein B